MTDNTVLRRLDAVVDAFCQRTRYFLEPMTPGRARSFVRQLLCRQLPQLIIDQRQNFIRRAGIPIFDLPQDTQPPDCLKK